MRSRMNLVLSRRSPPPYMRALASRTFKLFVGRIAALGKIRPEVIEAELAPDTGLLVESRENLLNRASGCRTRNDGAGSSRGWKAPAP